MAIIEWDDSLVFNIEKIDKQHRQLVKAIATLEKAMLAGESKAVLSDIFNELTIFLTVHFQTEETLFESIDYPEVEDHKKEHKFFIEKVSKFKNDFEEEKIGLAVDVMNFLCDWVINHIKNVDRKYADIIHNKE